MRRREFIAGLAGAAAWPLVAGAQQSDRVRRIGLLLSGSQGDARIVARHGKLPPRRHEELPPPWIAEERANERGANHGNPIVE
jgi:hypothetical protein